MEVENETNDPVDYDQSSGGGDDEETPSATTGVSGHLTAGGHATFAPAGPPPWTVTFTDDVTGAQCASAPFSNGSATVTVKGFNPCDVTVS